LGKWRLERDERWIVQIYRRWRSLEAIDGRQGVVPERALLAEPGMHRWIWNMHYPAVARGGEDRYPMTAIVHDTPPAQASLWVLPGMYSVKLTVNGRTYTQPLPSKWTRV
jgi:hypothetical protein